jgi:hypothetical protein
MPCFVRLGKRYYNMDNLVYAEPVIYTDFKEGNKVRHFKIVLVFIGQREDTEVGGSDAKRFIEYMNAHADTVEDLLMPFEQIMQELGIVS